MIGVPTDTGPGELERLRHRLATAERTIRQLRRENEHAESFALRSKQAILGTNHKLQDSIRALEAKTTELGEAKVRAERANDAKGRFVATISHELRTPMNGILGTAELLSHCDLPTDARELTSIIERSAKGLLRIINDVLDFSRAESGRIELEVVPFDLFAALRAIADLELNAARRKRIGLDLEIAPNVPQHVQGDPVRLRQVLLNLLDNAVKFTAVGAVALGVSMAEDGRVRFAVRDSGIGIEPAVQQLLFEPFVQADSSTTRRFGGSGLGLSICRHLVQLMGGRLVLCSEPGVGSTFSFDCRLAVAAAPNAAASAAECDGAPRVLQRIGSRVLAVDDNAINRQLLERMLERLGCEVVLAEGGQQAIELAANGRFDLVLMDCSMPDVDGLQATAKIRALPTAHAHVPIVALTAHALPGDRERCLAAGMDEYLSKPIRLQGLQSVLLDFAARARAAK